MESGRVMWGQAGSGAVRWGHVGSGTHVHAGVRACGGQTSTSDSLPLEPVPLIFEMGSLTRTWSLLTQSGCPTSKPQKAPGLVPSTGIRAVHHHTQPFMQGSNTGLHVCMATVLRTHPELSLCPPAGNFLHPELGTRHTSVPK